MLSVGVESPGEPVLFGLCSASPPPASHTAPRSSPSSREWPPGCRCSPLTSTRSCARRQQGYGRGRRMQIESDHVEFLSGVRAGETLGSPIAMLIRNRDWKNWQEIMDPAPREGDPGAQARGDASAARPRRPRRDAQVRSRRRARHSRARVGARDDRARGRRRDLQALSRASSASRSAATSCTSAASTRRRPDDNARGPQRRGRRIAAAHARHATPSRR